MARQNSPCPARAASLRERSDDRPGLGPRFREGGGQPLQVIAVRAPLERFAHAGGSLRNPVDDPSAELRLRGFGRSGKPKTGYGHDTLTEDLDAVLAGLDL